MENSMIEIVAKAIEAEKQRGGMAGSWTNADENQRLAEAAIRAMRIPTKAMIDAAEASEHGDDYHYAAPRHTWPLMIDAALHD